MGYWVRFAEDGTPEYHGSMQIDGAEWIDDKTDAELCTMRRRPNGTWARRPPPPRPTAEEIAAQRETERLERIEARREERRAARKAARLDRLFDRLVDVAARIDPEFAAEVAALEADFKDDE